MKTDMFYYGCHCGALMISLLGLTWLICGDLSISLSAYVMEYFMIKCHYSSKSQCELDIGYFYRLSWTSYYYMYEDCQ